MVDATLQVGAHERRIARISARMKLGWASAVADTVAMVGSYLIAETIRASASAALGMPPAQFTLSWSVVIFTVVTVLVFYASGLDEPEAYVSRPLHLWTLLKGTFAAFAASAVSVYVVRSYVFDESRLVLLMTFAIFVLLSCVLRLVVLDGLYARRAVRRKPSSLLVGDSETMLALEERLGHLRGFDRVERITPGASGLSDKEALEAALNRRWSTNQSTPSVFVDAFGLTPKAAYEIAAAAQALGADVYLISGLLEAVQGNPLASKLFGVPVTRLRKSIESAKPYIGKRALDILGSAAALLVFAPVIAVLGVLIRMSSPGPIFYRQTRIGRFGTPFEFVKLRSMIVNGDECIHSEYVRAFMNGTAEAVAIEAGGEGIFKRVDDPRITPIGRFVRKYSLDEIPQFWNVLRGDMSLVGPRPPLPYEVNEYDDWDSLRLSVPAGITGLWQVEGRSRVSFDEMILQDLVYAQNMRLLVDIELCLRTLPAMLLGGGGG